ncbi:unnamed protein product [Phyllotreta striolata]|uniref:BAG domain-containing protein n=1 Tax=Phyllotreta striolata TaxID=444603 RepID=A0A9N9THL7_PHYSR|nr:unnamed protein product [Phyllotreta striolata]
MSAINLINDNKPDELQIPDDDRKNENKGDDYESDIIDKILEIRSKIEKIEADIKSKSSEALKAECKIIEETLLQYIIKLDNIDTKSIDKVRDLRKKTILYTQDCLNMFDTKLHS